METGVAHRAAGATTLTCPPDIHLQSFSSVQQQLSTYIERTAGHRGPCPNKQEAVRFAEGGDTP
ncbi:Hypothetical protein SMAX5B_020245 [Scophthalmus maximus]|uniref:Uncharacterized protein n=1 Tax=Scophthalmus maximus TaxID=52904 RepID=A0A2U9CRQ4_SCOMX|nr:Hypothetical protein SMAX5B_020245 [Scophthalmus maximus]